MGSLAYSGDMAGIELKERQDQPPYAYSAVSSGMSATNMDAAQSRRPSWRDVWKKRLRRMFSSRRSRRILYIGSGIVLMLAWIGLILAFARNQQLTEKKHLLGDSKAVGSIAGEIWYLAGTLLHLDTNARTLAVQWSGKQFHLEDRENPLSSFEVSYNFPEGLNIYRDVQAIVDDDITQAQNDDYYYFMLDNATALPIGNVGMREWDAFDTDIDLAEKSTSVWTQPIRGYPFDVWTGSLVIAATDVACSRNVNRSNACVLSFDGTALLGDLINWKVTANSTSTCRILDSAFCDLACRIDFSITRPGLVKFTVIAVIIVNWLSTIVIFLLTGEALINGYKTEFLVGTDMLSVLFAALFALPGVRSLLPGAPDFGSTIGTYFTARFSVYCSRRLPDLVGILPNVIIISLCTSCWAVAKLRWQAKQKAESNENVGKA
ncbi:hypothetical protein BD626DRAFT_636413 [Schizophyllum amplum]|uniref:Uncharacterized protein n=1 Tax=Schizophyllum amplum TaxID=97359 RepID=A0A550BTD2_9AGAR|nr:hypothetical protein BD626DRAFT_636413 [Auriculariopsis ampla]